VAPDHTALVICPSSVAGGAEKSLIGLAKHLPIHGVRPVFVALQPGPLCDWLDALGSELHLLGAHRTRQLHATAATLLRITRIGRSVGASVYLSNQPKGHVFGGLSALLARKPEVWWQLGIPGSGLLQRSAAVVPTKTIACGCGEAKVAQHRLNRRTSLTTIYPGIDIHAIAARRGTGRAVRAKLGWDSNEIVGVVARLEPGKGHDVFIRAMGAVAAVRPEARCLVVGGALLGWEGDLLQRLESLAAAVGLGDRIHFAGHQDDVFPWFDACDVVVNPSFGEGFGLVVVEAMALGKAVVSTTAGGPAEIIEDGASGVLVAPHDAAAITDAVVALLTDRNARARLGDAAAVRACDFSEERCAERFAELLREVSR
jgi:glycosyltransferase involved in cell wall biosynthesis